MAGDRDVPENEDGDLPEDSEQFLEVVTEFAGIRFTSRIDFAVQQSSVMIRLDDPLIENDGDGLDE